MLLHDEHLSCAYATTFWQAAYLHACSELESWPAYLQHQTAPQIAGPIDHTLNPGACRAPCCMGGCHRL